MPKNIVVFSDGTGQEGGTGNNTNVYKMFNMIEDRTDRQVAFYDSGLGTDSKRLTGNVGGMGISRNIRECYRFIFDQYEVGDQIYLIGFSRGATTVRSLSSFIHYFGILPKSRPELIKKAYKIYKISDREKRKKEAAAFIDRHHNMWARVKFLGCFDTVAALGIPFKPLDVLLNSLPWFKHNFHDLTLSESVENAYHALAIDDARETFHPKLWDADCASFQTIQQVWFCGMHTDVGGGYAEQQLSDIPLVWMTDKAVACGLRIFAKHQVDIAEDIGGVMHDSRGGTLTKLFRYKARDWDNSRKDTPLIHQSVLMRKNNVHNQSQPEYTPWITQGHYEVEPWVRHEDQFWGCDKSL